MSKQTRKWKIVGMSWKFNIQIIVLKRVNGQNGGRGLGDGPVGKALLCKCEGWRLDPWHPLGAMVAYLQSPPWGGWDRKSLGQGGCLDEPNQTVLGSARDPAPVNKVQHDEEVHLCPPHACAQTCTPTCEHTCIHAPQMEENEKSKIPLRFSVRSNVVQWLKMFLHQSLSLSVSEH